MRVIVVFDVLEEYREVRDRLREFLKDMGGTFLQYSVYVADLDERGVERLLRGIRRILRRGAGRVDVLFPCERCLSKIRVLNTYEL
ncbi:MAG: CRISPR-associated endonuclease Cas2 [Thermoprotei archaeon]|nr:MAG: CRISPR-associated endonuclease Cas2 [Thermoprotei archaeon]